MELDGRDQQHAERRGNYDLTLRSGRSGHDFFRLRRIKQDSIDANLICEVLQPLFAETGEADIGLVNRVIKGRA